MPAPPARLASTSAAPSIATIAEGDELIRHLVGVMEQLLRVLDEETELVRAGRVSEVARLEPAKAELSRLYLGDAGVVKGNVDYLARELPEQFAALRTRHDTFHALLQINLAVLATAHAVSEGIIRGVAGELASKAAPQSYGSSGRANAPAAPASQPIALSRVL